MAMSEAARKAAGERMRALQASGRMKRKPVSLAKKLAEQTKKNNDFMNEAESKHRSTPVIDVQVDWQNIDLAVAQSLFSKLRTVLDGAGKIINSRLSEPIHYPCEICRRMVTANNAKFMDSSYKDPETGLIRASFCCSEECYSKYMRDQIEQRRQSQQRR
jgi:hypothetical protein